MTIVTIVTLTPIYTHTRARMSANRKMRQDRHDRHNAPHGPQCGSLYPAQYPEFSIPSYARHSPVLVGSLGNP
jgi:hypothetical protein